MSAAHLLYIPGALLIGLILGYVLGARAVREELGRQRDRAKR